MIRRSQEIQEELNILRNSIRIAKAAAVREKKILEAGMMQMRSVIRLSKG
jgi:hypothetical protein